MRIVLSILAAIAVAGTSNSAMAAETIWFDSDHTVYGGDYPLVASLIFSGGGINVRVSGWSVHSDGGIYRAQLGIWPDGLGVKNGRDDNSHTIDNDGFVDFVLFQFDRVVELESARFWTGWHGMNDTDATVGYAITGMPFASPPALHGLPQTQLASLNLYSSGGWGNGGDSFRNINPGGKIGNLWLIGAAFDNPEGSKKRDGFKLDKLTFSLAPPSAVPEPSTWAMLLVGFGAIGGAMRTRRKPSSMVSQI